MGKILAHRGFITEEGIVAYLAIGYILSAVLAATWGVYVVGEDATSELKWYSGIAHVIVSIWVFQRVKVFVRERLDGD